VPTDDDLSDVLSEFARTMVTDFPIQGILDHLVKRIVDIMPVTAAGVTLISPGSDPRFVAASSPAALRFEKLQTELDEGPCVAAYRTGEPVSVPDLSADTQFAAFSPRARAEGMEAVFTFPLRHGESRPLGALDLYREETGTLTDRSMTAAQTLADVAAAYLINAQARAELQDSSDRAREAALHDGLTGLPNRILLLERLRHACLRARRSHKISVLFFLDLDRFKAINDVYGHRAGDELLIALSERLVAELRPGDTLARVSGDEFAVLCEELDDRSEADAIVARVDAALSRPFDLSTTQVSTTASIGVAFTGANDEPAESLLHAADVAMYRNKHRKAGGNLFDVREQSSTDQEDDLAQALPGAAERGELHLAYQPIVTAGDGGLFGLEALLRWKHPTRGMVSPTTVIPLAERTGLIIDIGRWVLEQAWTAQRDWQRQRSEQLAVSVNVSAHQLMSVGFADTVASVLETAPTDPGLLTLEITESVFVRDGERALVVLNELKDLGVMLALDDFGTGYSSLSYLMRYPVDYIKVDREFVASLGRDPASGTIVGAVVQLAHGLGMTVVSEGVETDEQHSLLSELECDYCQGFYFARPLSGAGLDTVIRQGADGRNPQLPA
jgi:diguanylate cyclase (GGDEF)-like protein